MSHPAPVAALPARSWRGFTLVELMVVVVIAAILAAVGFPSYMKSVQKGRRPDAMSALATIQQAQERYRGTSPTYQSDISALPGATATSSPSGYYTLSIVANSVSASGYTIRATADAGDKQASDSTCQIFEVQMAGGRISYRSYASGGAQNGTPDPCWVR
jgi:type IV pilus assembly protein PilE